MSGISPLVYEQIVSLTSSDRVFLNEPMDKHTTFRVGGEADLLIKISNKDELKALIRYLNLIEANYFILGNGSNLLVSDRGYRGIIIELSDKFNDIRVEGDNIYASAGALMSSIARVAYENSLTGMEFASGIPGTIGGGACMNAGAYDGELKDIITSVTVINKDGEELCISNSEMRFSYRHSILKERPFIVTEVCISLSKGDSNEIKAKMDELNQKRRDKQPLEYPSAGSTFKRPEGYFAGKLIMEAGLRGYTIGGAQVSEKHCGFVVNKGNATASDVYELICEVREKVYQRFLVKLEPEVIFLGEF